VKLPRAAGWALLASSVLALILVPFALGEGKLFELSRTLLAAPESRALLATLVVLLLASDLILPIPSSFVAAGAVLVLGPPLAAAAIWLGMTAGALLGYALGRSGGRALALRVVGASELERAERLHDRFGAAVLVVCRGVPVLAEASTLFAGAVRMRFPLFAFVAGAANAGLAFAYAAFGDLGSGALAMLVPFALGVLVPAIALAILKLLEGKRDARVEGRDG
jgi:membrane protein DedA with SNARE-associated domain